MNKNDIKNNKIYDATEFANLRDAINNAINLYPNNDAFIIKTNINNETNYKHITYKMFGNDINALGTKFINIGLKDKRIAIIGKNRYEWMVSYLATINGTGLVVPLDKGLPEQEIISSLNRSKADAIIFESSYSTIMENIKNNKLTSVQKFICMDDDTNFDSLSTLIENGKKLLENGNNSFLNSKIDNEKMSIILFTSGTTSLSKAVMLSHKNICSNIYAMQRFIKIYHTDVNMAFLPYHHTFGCTGQLLFLCCGSTNVFCDGLRHIQKNLNEYKVSIFVCVPLLLEAMYKQIQKTIDKTGKREKLEKGLKISKTMLKFGIDIRRKLSKILLII